MTSGSSKREESVQFSLTELLKLEDERIEEQRRTKDAEEKATAKALAAKAAKAKSDAEEQVRLQAIAAEKKKAAELDEVARREAMQKAVVEQARLEVEARTRHEERELERKHEIELARLRATETKNGMGALAVSGLIGAALVLVVTLGVHFGVTKPATDRQIAQLEQSAVSENSRANDLGRRVKEDGEKIASLERNLAAVQAENTTLKSSKTTAPTPSTHTGPRGNPVPNRPQPQPPPPGPKCQEGDPMCFQIR